jgi:hypothetical protein
MRTLSTLSWLCLLAACHGKTKANEPADSAPPPPTASNATTADASVQAAAARCKVAGTGPSLGLGADGVVVGDVVRTGDAVAVGLLRSAGSRTSASVAIVSQDLSSVALVDLGPAVGDSPPPRPYVQNGQLFAASYVRASLGGHPQSPGDGGEVSARTVGFHRIDGGKSSLVATQRQGLDESLAFDVAAASTGPALVTWDEDAPSGDHGVIKVATIDGAQLGEPSSASPDATDAEEPRVAPSTGGRFWVAWLAHRPRERSDGGEAGTELEGPAESRESRWIEMVVVGPTGKALGTPRRLSPPSGHVSAFSLVPRADDAVDVVYRDDEEQTEGAGGRILRVSVHGDASSAPVVLVPVGAGHGAPEAMSASWLVYSDTADHAKVLPLAESGRPSSLEPALDDGRVLAVTEPPQHPAALSVVYPREKDAPVRVVSCVP